MKHARDSGKAITQDWWSEVLRANLHPADIYFYPRGLSISDRNMTFAAPKTGVSQPQVTAKLLQSSGFDLC